MWRASLQLVPRRYELGFLIAGAASFAVIVYVTVGGLGFQMELWK